MIQLDIECAIRSEANVLISGGDAVSRSSLARLIHERSSGRQAFIVAAGGDRLQGQQPERDPVEPAGRTLFIEELAALDDMAQSELMRLLDRESRVVADRTRDTRIIAGTAHALTGPDASDLFKTDLFYRLNTIHIVIDPRRRAGKPPTIH